MYSKMLDLPEDEKRQRYQEYGQGMRQIFGEPIWCKSLVERHQKDIDNGNLIIADARQENEYEYFVNELGFTPIAVVASEEDRKARVVERDGYSQLERFNHDTEVQAGRVIERIKADNGIVISNDGTLGEFKFKIKHWCIEQGLM